MIDLAPLTWLRDQADCYEQQGLEGDSRYASKFKEAADLIEALMPCYKQIKFQNKIADYSEERSLAIKRVETLIPSENSGE